MTGRTRTLPPLIADLLADRVALAALGAACLTIAAAGIDPHILDPNSVRMKSLMVENPNLVTVLSLAAIVQAAFILIGGALADLFRSTRLLRAALIGLVIASVGVTIWPTGPVMVAFRVLAWACDGMIIPFSVAVVAQLYAGETRGTAIGILLAAYGAATFIAPILPTIFGPGGPEIQAFALCAGLSIAAFVVSKRHLPALPGALPEQRLTIVSTAIWAIGVVIAVDGLVQAEPWMIGVGAVIVVVALSLRRLVGGKEQAGVKARAGGAALAAGMVIGFSQAIPMTAMPLFFAKVQGFDTLVASALIAPFVIGVIIAGPTAGLLLARFSPRQLILSGVWAIAVSDILFAVLLSTSSSYLAFILPFIVLGAGFMVATAVRTAVIFASTPRRMAGMASALNEASLGVGTRLGVTVVLLLQAGLLPGATSDPILWLRTAMVFGGLVGVAGGIVIVVLLGRQNPVRTMWDHRDERETPAA